MGTSGHKRGGALNEEQRGGHAEPPQAGDSSLKPQASPQGAPTADVRASRMPVYMMHPLGGFERREANRWLACQWQAAIQAAHPEWLVLAPWIGLSGAWSEDKREEGMAVDFATIDLCEAGVIAGPLDGPCTGITHGREYQGVSPGMAAELAYFSKFEPQEKPLLDARTLFDIKLPPDWFQPRWGQFVAKENRPNDFKPRFKEFEIVLCENKPGGACHVVSVDEQAPGAYRYLIERREQFFAHEQSLAKLKNG
jgi:hypothetical protein